MENKFNRKKFDYYMILACKMVDNDPASAWELLMKAEQELQPMDSKNEILWANVMDQMRNISYMNGQFKLNEAICREILSRFHFPDPRKVLIAEDPVLNTIRSAANLLARRISERMCTHENVSEAIGYLEIAFKRYHYPGEKELIYQFYDTKAKVYLWASTLYPQYLEKLRKGLEIIRRKKLADRGLITDKAILALLADHK